MEITPSNLRKKQEFHLCVPGIPGGNAIVSQFEQMAKEYSFTPPPRIYQIGVPRDRVPLELSLIDTAKFAIGEFLEIIRESLPPKPEDGSRVKAFVDFEPVGRFAAMHGPDDAVRMAYVRQMKMLMQIAHDYVPWVDLMFWAQPRTPARGRYPLWMSHGTKPKPAVGGNDRLVDLGMFEHVKDLLVQMYVVDKIAEPHGEHFEEDGYATEEEMTYRIWGTIAEAHRLRVTAGISGSIIAAVSPLHYFHPWKHMIVDVDEMDLTHKALVRPPIVVADGVMMWLQRESWSPEVRERVSEYPKRYSMWF
jgi:hypothetical protein